MTSLSNKLGVDGWLTSTINLPPKCSRKQVKRLQEIGAFLMIKHFAHF